MSMIYTPKDQKRLEQIHRERDKDLSPEEKERIWKAIERIGRG